MFAVLVSLVAPWSAGDTFRAHKKHFQVGPNPNAIIAQDLTGDGLPEICTADRGEMTSPRAEKPANDEVSFLVAHGDLTYVSETPLKTGFAPYCIVVANIDQYRDPDLVVGSFHAVKGRCLTLFRNLPDGVFESSHFTVPATQLRYERMKDIDGSPIFTKPGITSLVVRDFNSDGFRDVVATGWASDVLVFFPGAADTHFGAHKLTQAPGGPRDVAVADFDKDGHLDLATTQYISGEVALWRGNGTGNFEAVDRFGTRGALPHKIRIADVNGDGHADLAVSHCYASDSVTLCYGDGGFSFEASQEYRFDESREVLTHEIRDILVDDFNGDNKTDFAAACFGSRQVVVLINTSEDTKAPQTFRKETYSYKEGRPRALCAADFNVDGAMDIGVALWEENTVALLLGTPGK
jgi:FG-GAP-like repeat